MSDPINEDNTILQTGLGSSIPVYYGSRYQRGMGMEVCSKVTIDMLLLY